MINQADPRFDSLLRKFRSRRSEFDSVLRQLETQQGQRKFTQVAHAKAQLHDTVVTLSAMLALNPIDPAVEAAGSSDAALATSMEWDFDLREQIHTAIGDLYSSLYRVTKPLLVGFPGGAAFGSVGPAALSLLPAEGEGLWCLFRNGKPTSELLPLTEYCARPEYQVLYLKEI